MLLLSKLMWASSSRVHGLSAITNVSVPNLKMLIRSSAYLRSLTRKLLRQGMAAAFKDLLIECSTVSTWSDPKVHTDLSLSLKIPMLLAASLPHQLLKESDHLATIRLSWSDITLSHELTWWNYTTHLSKRIKCHTKILSWPGASYPGPSPPMVRIVTMEPQRRQPPATSLKLAIILTLAHLVV